MFRDFLNSTFTVTRTTTVKDATTHIASEVTQTLGPFQCRVAMTSKSNGNFTQAQPQSISTQNFQLYALVTANVKNGDIATIDGVNYIVSNVYAPANHHIEANITIETEV